jgi:hypothetical protein
MLRIIAAVALIYFGLGLFNVPWLLRVRIILSMAAGGLIVGALGYPIISPADPLGAVSLFTGEITVLQMLMMVVLGFCSGVVATVACYPMGNVLGPFAAPTGVAVLALNSGSMSQLLMFNNTLAQRNALYGALRWEILFWLAICAAGYLGVYITCKVLGTKTLVLGQGVETNEKKSNLLINAAIAAIAAAAIVYFTIGIFAQDIKQIDEQLGSVVGQAGSKQIAFGVFVSTAIAAFIAKKFVKIHFSAVILGVVGMYIVVFTQLINSETLKYIIEKWTIYYAPHTVYTILPVQLVPFAALGALTGYWIGVRMDEPPVETEE